MRWFDRLRMARTGELKRQDMVKAIETVDRVSAEAKAKHEPMPFVIRPIDYDITTEQKRPYSYRELKNVGGVDYYFYYTNPPPKMDDDEKYTDYLNSLSSLEATSAGRYMLNWNKDSMKDFFKCKCRVCTSPPAFETFYITRDYKVVEGVRQVRCEGILGNVGMDSAWMDQKLKEARLQKGDFYADWPHPDEFTPIATITDAHTGTTRAAAIMADNMLSVHERLDRSLAGIRQGEGQPPSPYLTDVYKVTRDKRE